MTIDRRQFLRITVAGAVTSVAGPLVGAPAASDDPHALWALAHPDLLVVLGAQRVSAIGARYREASPSESDPEALRAAIAVTTAQSRPAGDYGQPDLSALIARDFAEERAVIIDGWVLSITEARQCALFSLLGR